MRLNAGSTSGHFPLGLSAQNAYFGIVPEDVGSPMPCAGKLSKLYINQSGSPGGSAVIDFELYKNGVATGFKVTYTAGGSLTVSDLSTELLVNSGDGISVKYTVVSGSLASATFPSLSIRFDPAEQNLQPIYSWLSGGLGSTGIQTTYFYLGSMGSAIVAGPSHNGMMPTDVSWRAPWARQNVAPGAGNTRQWDIRNYTDAQDMGLISEIIGTDLITTPDTLSAYTLANLKGMSLTTKTLQTQGVPTQTVVCWPCIVL
jgi:hypothetical protein